MAAGRGISVLKWAFLEKVVVFEGEKGVFGGEIALWSLKIAKTTGGRLSA